MKTKTKIGKQVERKGNRELVETILAAKKKEKWIKVACVLSGPRRKAINLNLEDINKNSKDGETIIIPGKVLSQGEITKKIKIAAQGFSEKAKEKLEKAGIPVLSLIEEIKKNPSMEKCRVLTRRK
ncbi:MAG TPA: 50S ribosomal protein L18e [Bacillota bacterium]|nr:50S ribosomal protein L18e [Bacillota bacterium]